MKCQRKTPSGNQCKANALKGGRYCFQHAPETRQAAARARKLGGHNSATPHAGDPGTIPGNITDLDAAAQILNYTLAELLVIDNSIPRARALLALFDSYVKAFEIGELEKRIAALEARTK